LETRKKTESKRQVDPRKAWPHEAVVGASVHDQKHTGVEGIGGFCDRGE